VGSALGWQNLFEPVTGDRQAVSTVVGATLMLIVLVLLVSVVAVMTSEIGSSTMDSSALHGVGQFQVDYHESGGDSLYIAPDTLDGRGSEFVLRVNGHEVHRWDGQGEVEMTCLYPGDHVQIVSEAGSTTDLIQERTLQYSLKCDRISAIDEKFEDAFVHYDGTSERVRVQDDYTFDLSIDPQGPGSDSPGRDTFRDTIGPIPVTNQWHYVRRYDREVEGLEPPVWVIVMTDNVHWKTGSNYPHSSVNYNNYNWTDAPPMEAKQHAAASYSIDTGGELNLSSDISDLEPTNDIYLVFKPRCDAPSTLKIVEVSAGYHNQIRVNGDVAIEDTYDYSRFNSSFDTNDYPVEIDDAPSVNCPG